MTATQIVRGPADPERFRAKVGRFKERFYVDPLPACPIADASPDGEAWPSITTTLNSWPKHLTGWAARLSAEFAYDQQAAWVPLARDAAVPLIAAEHERQRDRAADRGTHIHSLLEAHALDRPGLAELAGQDTTEFANTAARLIADLNPTIVLSEVVLIRRGDTGFGGTADALWHLDLPGITGRYWIDFRTSTRTDAYPEKAAQLGGYSLADYMIVEADGIAQRAPMPEVDGALVIVITADDYAVHPVNLDHAQTAYQALRAFWAAQRNPLLGRPIHINPAAPAPCASSLPPAPAAADLPPTPVAPTTPSPVVVGQPEREPTPIGDLLPAVIAAIPDEPIAPIDLGPGHDPAAPCTPDRHTWIRTRVQSVKDAGHLDALQAAWPTGVPGFLVGHHHTNHEVDLIDQVCWQVETAATLPFPEPQPDDPSKVPGDHPTVTDIAQRFAALPADLQADVANEMTTRGYPKITSGQATPEQVAMVNGWVTAVEARLGSRTELVTAHLAVIAGNGADPHLFVTAATGGRTDNPAGLTQWEADRVGDLVDAVALGWLDHTLTAVDCVKHAGGSGRLRDLGKQAAAELGIKPAPRSATDVTGNPLLIAWVALNATVPA